jgi:hypothetical protein
VAKKKTAKSSEAAATPRSAAPKKVVAKLAVSERALSSVEVGNTAGEVWQALSSGGPQTLAGLKKQVAAPGDLVAAAVGWLAREGKLSFRANGRSVVVELREEN